MKTKFKVGQKVLVARKGDCWNFRGEMDHWIAKVMTIREITDYGSYRMEEDAKENRGHGWVFSDEDLEPAERITVTRCGNKVIATNALGESAEAKCHPEDTFNFETGAKLAMNRLFEKEKELKVGDKVRVVSAGMLYSTYDEWVVRNIADKRLIARYQYNRSIDTSKVYRIRKIALHSTSVKRVLAYIESTWDESCFLIGIEGIEKA